MQLYNIVGETSGIRAYAFEKMLSVCMDSNCMEIMIERARQIVDVSKAWKLSTEERRDLYDKTA